MKRSDIIVHFCNGSEVKFNAVKLKTGELSNRESEMAMLTFDYGVNNRGALINLDNVNYFEITRSCTEG